MLRFAGRLLRVVAARATHNPGPPSESGVPIGSNSVFSLAASPSTLAGLNTGAGWTRRVSPACRSTRNPAPDPRLSTGAGRVRPACAARRVLPGARDSRPPGTGRRRSPGGHRVRRFAKPAMWSDVPDDVEPEQWAGCRRTFGRPRPAIATSSRAFASRLLVRACCRVTPFADSLLHFGGVCP